MNSLLVNNWLLIANSVLFWLAPIFLIIHLALMKDKSNSYQKKISYFYGTIWAIALIIYLVTFLS